LRHTGATEDSIAAFEAALEVASDNKRRCMAMIGMAEGLRIADRHTRALEVLQTAEAAAVHEGLVDERGRIHYLRGNVYFPLGNIEGCLAEHEKALVFARQVNSAESEALALGGLGDAHYLRGHMRTACEQFRACIELCRDQGYGYIEVANRHMIGWSRIHFMEFAEALEDALESAELAAKVSNQRAEVLGLMLAGRVYFELGQLADANNHARRALDLALSISANNFAAQSLMILAQISASEGQVGEAIEHVERAVEIVRKVGMTFIGPTVLAVKAAVTEDMEEASRTLQEAEAILDAGCVAHNHVWFARTAIDHAVAIGAWDRAEHYAARLEEYTRGQPLAWPDFMIARARALAAWGRGTRSRDVIAELEQLRECAVRHGLVLATPQLDEALAAA
jgi:tetratricopeptide (TPR) repeat protein